MVSLKRILFPVDLSEASPVITPWVTSIAEKFGADIHVLYVSRVFDHYSGMGVPYTMVSSFADELAKGAEKKLTEFMAANLKNASATGEVVTGYPPEEILGYARKNEIDLIVMGTHGRKGIDRIIFGSVADQVVKKSPVPVLTVKPY